MNGEWVFPVKKCSPLNLTVVLIIKYISSSPKTVKIKTVFDKLKNLKPDHENEEYIFANMFSRYGFKLYRLGILFVQHVLFFVGCTTSTSVRY